MVLKRDLTIFDLNDNCLIEIVKFLEPKDLFSLTKVHKKFHNAIGHVVAADGTKEIQLGGYHKLESKKNVENFFRLFGNKIRNLVIDPNWMGMHPRRAEKLFTRYCCAGNIEICKFVSFSVRNGVLAKNLPFFESLKSLKVTGVVNSAAVERVLLAANQLETLVIGDGFGEKDKLLHIIAAQQKLKKLHFSYYNFGRASNEFTRLPINTTLSHLSVTLYWDSISLLNQFPNIETLKLRMFRRTQETGVVFTPIIKMAKLKQLKLTLSSSGEESSGLQMLLMSLAKLRTLDHLELDLHLAYYKEQMADIIKHLSEITNLKSLSLSVSVFSLKYFSLIDLAMNLKKMHTFRFDCQFASFGRNNNFDVIDEEVIFEFVSHSENLKTFVIGTYKERKRLNSSKLYRRLASMFDNSRNERKLTITVRNMGERDTFSLNAHKLVKMNVEFDLYAEKCKIFSE